MIAIAIVLVISNEFGTSTNVDLIAAANYRDQMRAHFLARSAMNLSELVIRIQQRLDNVQQLRDAGIRITDFADQVLLAFCGNPEEVQAMVGFSSSDVKGLGVDIGTCGIVDRQITTDDDKINLNCANFGKAPGGRAQGHARGAGLLPGLRSGVRGRRRRGLPARPRDPGRRDPRLRRRRRRAHPRHRHHRGVRLREPQGPVQAEEQLHRHGRRAPAGRAGSTIGSGPCSARRSRSTAAARSTSARSRTPS